MVDVQQDTESTITATAQVMSKTVDIANIEVVFGHPVERGETIVIPCAEVSMGGGMVIGSGPIDRRSSEVIPLTRDKRRIYDDVVFLTSKCGVSNGIQVTYQKYVAQTGKR